MNLRNSINLVLNELEDRFTETGKIGTHVIVLAPSGDGAVIIPSGKTTEDEVINKIEEECKTCGAVGVITITPLVISHEGATEGKENTVLVQAVVETRTNMWLFEWEVDDSVSPHRLVRTAEWEDVVELELEYPIRRFLQYGATD